MLGALLAASTLDLLILRALVAEPLHGYAIVQRLRVTSGDVLRFGEGSSHPAGTTD
jgi:PadR family transcriptional regulator